MVAWLAQGRELWNVHNSLAGESLYVLSDSTETALRRLTHCSAGGAGIHVEDPLSMAANG